MCGQDDPRHFTCVPDGVYFQERVCQPMPPAGADSYQVIGMLHEPLIAAPVANVTAEQPAPLDVGAEISVPPATGEQVRTADAVTTTPTEGDKVLGMLGMWTGVLLLHDLAVEHFESREDLEQERPRKKEPEDDGPTPE